MMWFYLGHFKGLLPEPFISNNVSSFFGLICISLDRSKLCASDFFFETIQRFVARHLRGVSSSSSSSSAFNVMTVLNPQAGGC